MSINYTVIDQQWMTHTDRKLRWETECDGCGEPLPRYVCIITDRSGSEYGVTHLDNQGCLDKALTGLSLTLY